MRLVSIDGNVPAHARAACAAGLLLATLVSCAGSGSSGAPTRQSCAVPAPSSPTSAALRLAMSETWNARFRQDDHGARAALRSVYSSAAGPLWLAQGRPTRQALALLSILRSAQDYGLQPTDYHAARLSAAAAAMSGAGASGVPQAASLARDQDSCDAGRAAQFELDLSAAAAAFVSDLHYGRIDPRAAGFNLGEPRPDDLDLAGALRTLASSGDVASSLAAFEPQFEHYRLLERALPQYLQRAAADPGDAVLAGRVARSI